ncbi:Protein kinase domain containing protein [Entamoeba marina]
MFLLVLLFLLINADIVIFSNVTTPVLTKSFKCDECIDTDFYHDNSDLMHEETQCTNETSLIVFPLLNEVVCLLILATYNITLHFSHTLDSFSPPTFMEVYVGENEPQRFEVNDKPIIYDECVDCVSEHHTFFSPSYRIIGTTLTLRALGNIVCFSSASVTQYLTIQGPDIRWYSPRVGPISGGTIISIKGLHFYNDGQYSCVFNDIESEITFISSQSVECIAPQMNSIKSMKVLIINSYFPETVLTTFNFEFYDVSFTTATIYEDVDGDSIKVCGSGVIEAQHIECNINSDSLNTTVNGIYLNENCVLCLFDPSNMTETILISVLLDGQHPTPSVTLKWKDPFPYVIITAIVFICLIILLFAIIITLLIIKRFKLRKVNRVKGWINLDDVYFKEKIYENENTEIWKGVWKGVTLVVKTSNITLANIDGIKEDAKRLKYIRHPCIIQFFGFSLEQQLQQLSILVEFMPRYSLFDVLHSSCKQLPIATKFRMLSDASKGIEYLHSLTPSIIHGNIKSKNLLVSSNYSIKISDFSFSKHYPKIDSSCIPWTAPEVLMNQERSIKSDVYSIGIIIWEVMSNLIPFDNIDSDIELINLITQGSHPPILSTIPSVCNDLILACWRNYLERDILVGEIVQRIERWKTMTLT